MKYSVSVLWITAVLFLSACGGGSGGSAAGGSGVTPTPPPTVPPPVTPPSGPTVWQQGVFPAEQQLKNYCENPRSGTDPFNNNRPYPDLAGNAMFEKMWLRSWSHRTYLWYRELPDLDPQNFSVAEYFAQLKTSAKTDAGTPKDNFHFSQNTAEYLKETQGGTRFGYGINWYVASSRPPRRFTIAYNEPSSPATSAALPRGAVLVAIDGVDFVNEASASALSSFNRALFPTTVGQRHEFRFQLPSGELQTVSLTSADVVKVPVPQSLVLDSAAGKVGYLQFNSYVAAAQPQLIRSIRQFNDANIQELVVDLRYNGGGLLALAAQLGYMLAGPQVIQGRIFERSVFNDKHPNVNPITGQALQPLPFISRGIDYNAGQYTNETLPFLSLRRVFILTTDDTCSASEALINGLRGIDMDVVLIGGKTCGKPYGFYPTDNCGTTYFTIQFSGVNAKGFGEFADGFRPTENPVLAADVKGCAVADDFSRALGNPQERLLQTAIHYMRQNQCPVLPQAAPISTEPRFDSDLMDWQLDPRKRAIILENKLYSPNLPTL